MDSVQLYYLIAKTLNLHRILQWGPTEFRNGFSTIKVRGKGHSTSAKTGIVMCGSVPLGSTCCSVRAMHPKNPQACWSLQQQVSGAVRAAAARTAETIIFMPADSNVSETCFAGCSCCSFSCKDVHVQNCVADFKRQVESSLGVVGKVGIHLCLPDRGPGDQSNHLGIDSVSVVVSWG